MAIKKDKKNQIIKTIPKKTTRSPKTNHSKINDINKENAEKYRHLFNSIDEGFCIIEMIFDAENKPTDYRFLEINPAFENQTGLHNAKGKLMSSLAPEHEEHWFQIYGRIALTGKSERFINEAKALDRWYDVYAFPIGVPEKRKVAILFKDITKVKNAEKELSRTNDELEAAVQERTDELQSNEEKYRSIIETADEGIWICDTNAITIFVNKKMTEMLGYTEKQLIGKTPYEFMDQQAKDLAMANLKRRLKGHSDRYEQKYIRKDGSILWAVASVTPLLDKNKRVVSSLGMIMDITERKQLEEARQTAFNRFYTVLSEMPLGVLLVTEDGLIELANQAFCDIFKLKQSPAELKNLNSDEVIEKIRNMLVNPERAVARIREIVTQEKPVRDEEVPMLGEKTVLRDFIPIQIHEKQYGRLWIHIDITDRKKMEENNSYLASFPELNSNPILELDRDGKIKYQNPACKSIFPDLFELGLTHPFLRDWENVINKLTADNSGQYVIRDIQVCDLFYEQACFSVGKNQIRIYARDITKRKLAEQSLQVASENLRHSKDTSPLGIRIVNENGKTVYSNKALLDIYGYENYEDFNNVPVEDRNTSESLAKSRLRGERRLRGEPTANGYEVSVMRKDGTIRHLRVFLNEILWERKMLRERLYQDITETKQAEEKLKNQFAILKGIIESPLTPIFSVDEKYCYTSFNSIHAGVMKSIYGTDIEVGKSILDYMIVAKDRDIAKANFDRALNGEHFSAEAYSGEELLNRSFFNVNHSPIRNGEGRIIGVVVFAEDITERRWLEQEKDKYNKELVEKNAELERFTYTVSHDLKSPLVTIKTFLGYLTQDMTAADKEHVEKDLLFINDAADKMGLLLQELLEMSRIGRVINPPVKITSEQLIKDAVGIMAGPIADMGVKVQVTGESVALYGDRTRLLEIWQNLLENAVKFMGGRASPQIEIGIELRGMDTVFFVRDNGIGIESQYQAKIFNLFEKIDAKTEGTGMGLAIVKRIVELYQGRIWVESKGLGQGSCFRFTLPSALKEKEKG